MKPVIVWTLLAAVPFLYLAFAVAGRCSSGR